MTKGNSVFIDSVRGVVPVVFNNRLRLVSCAGLGDHSHPYPGPDLMSSEFSSPGHFGQHGWLSPSSRNPRSRK